MIFLVFALAFLISYMAVYIVSFFSGDSNNPISVLKATGVLWGTSIILNTFHISGIIGMGISLSISLFVFIKFLGFEPMPAFLAGMFYSILYFFMLLFLVSFFMG